MGKKSKKAVAVDQAQTSAAAITDAAGAKVALADLARRAQAAVEEKDWAALLALGQTPLADIVEADQKAARRWLPRARVYGLNLGDLSTKWVQNIDHKALKAALDELAVEEERFFDMPEFDLYLDLIDRRYEGRVEGFRKSLQAFEAAPRLNRVLHLREFGFPLFEANAFVDLTPQQEKLKKQLPEADVLLAQAYSEVLAKCELSEEERILVEVLRLELQTELADVRNCRDVAQRIASFPSPEPVALREHIRENWGPRTSVDGMLTPRGWAFIWEVTHTSSEDMPALLQRYPPSMGSTAVDALHLIARGIFNAPGPAADKQLLEGAGRILAERDAEWLSFRIAVADKESKPLIIDLPRSSLRIPSIGEVLYHLVEHAPAGHPRAESLRCLFRLHETAVIYGTLEREDATEAEMPGLAWLRENPAVELVAGGLFADLASSCKLLVRGLRRCTEQGIEPTQDNFTGALDGEEKLPPDDMREVVDELALVVQARPRMSEMAHKVWLDVVKGVFTVVRKADRPLRKRVLELARLCSDELIDAQDAFTLAYLEQVDGDPLDALHYYLVDLNLSERPGESSAENAKILFRDSTDVEEVRELVKRLEEERSEARHRKTVDALLGEAQARYKALNEQAQFEKTALQRWPSLTAPARKLLGVLNAIERYGSFRELGSYAGMDEKWARIHYDKLVETGMLLVGPKGFRINPHISPLLEREAQHDVVRRIVQIQGTNAVKQVFNSQREFTIYQVMVQLCPNHLVFPNASLQCMMRFDKLKELVSQDDFGYYLRASVDLVVVSSTTYLPMLAIEVDSVWHDTEKQQERDERKDRLFAAAGIPFMRLRPVGSPSESTIRAQVAEHLDELVKSLRADLPEYNQARALLENLSGSGQ